MKEKALNTFKAVLFCAIGAVVFGFIQRILTPNHNENQLVEEIIKGCDSLEENTLDVVFIGPSDTLFSVYPMDIYKQTGVKAYNLSIVAQPIDLSYEILKKTFKNQSPKVVVLSAGYLRYKDNEVNMSFRYYADNIPFSAEKIELAKNYTKYGYPDGTMSILFPIIKYHNRWSELSKDDFARVTENLDAYYFTMGAHVADGISSAKITAEDIDSIINEMIKRDVSEIKYRDKNTEDYQTKVIDTPLRTIAISDNNKKILKQMKDLCDANDCKLILTSIPTIDFPMNSPDHAWGKDIQEQIETLAADMNIEYLDFTYNIDVGIDMNNDTLDGGHHLNIAGAQKITSYFCNYFMEQGIVGTGSDPVWDEQLVKWDKLMEIVDWQTDMDFHSYLNKLITNKGKLDIFISTSTTYSDALTVEEIEMFKQLGLTLVGEGSFCDSYAAIVSGGDVKYEAVSPRKIEYNTTLNDGTKVNLVSSGWYTGSLSSIIINGIEYSPNRECLNFVIREKETGMVIDCVCFATRYPEKTAIHSRQWELLDDYQRRLCQGE